MRKLIEHYWKKLQTQTTPEQVFYLFLILAFSAYHKNNTKQKKEMSNSNSQFNKGYFAEIFADIHDSVFNEAFRRFSDVIDWEFVAKNQDTQKILVSIQDEFNIYFSASSFRGDLNLLQKLDEILDILTDLENRMGSYKTIPHSIQTLLLELLGKDQTKSVMELCCGTATFGMKLWYELQIYNPDVEFEGIDIDTTLCNIAKLNLYFHGINTITINQNDLLKKPDSVVESSKDLIIVDVPRGNNRMLEYDRDDLRLREHDKSGVFSDWIFLQEALYRLSPQGRAVALITTGALIRMNEKCLREQVILNDWLEAVITLPQNLYSNTRTSTELLIFNKGKSIERKNKILFADISKYSRKYHGNLYSITEQGINAVKTCVEKWIDISDISIIQDREYIDKENYSLKPIQYIQGFQKQIYQNEVVLKDIAQIVRGSQVTKRKNTDEADDGTACFLNIKDIQSSRIRFETAERIDENHPAWKEKFLLKADDLLITSKGTAIKLALVEENPPLSFFSGNLTLIRVDKTKYHPYILYEYLNSKQGRRALEEIQSGTTIRILNNANLGNLRIPGFNFKRMNVIGEKLKNQRETFLSEEKSLVNEYQRQREILLKELEEE